MSIAVSNICQAFQSFAVGTKVTNVSEFMHLLADAVKGFTFTDGTGKVPLPAALPYVTSGVARREGIKPGDYVVRPWRGEVGLFASRRFAAPAESLHVIVYTGEAYKRAAPDDTAAHGAAFVIVAVLAAVGPNPPVGSGRFVRNLAGGNEAYSPAKGYTLERAIEDAKAITAYEAEWVTVAD